jgi:hypothetical protein
VERRISALFPTHRSLETPSYSLSSDICLHVVLFARVWDAYIITKAENEQPTMARQPFRRLAVNASVAYQSNYPS